MIQDQNQTTSTRPAQITPWVDQRERGLRERQPHYPDRHASILAIIPAYNEEENIAHVIRGIKIAAPFADILVINDGALDATARVARRSGAGVLNLPFNLGIGGAVQAGIKFAWAHGYPFLVRLDGDGQHNPEDIPRLLQVVMQGRANIAIGSRFLPGHEAYRAPSARRLGIRYFSLMVSLMAGHRVYDTTSGFQCMDRHAIQYFARYYPQDYPEVEAHILTDKVGLQVVEIPVTMRPRRSGVSSIGLLRSIYYVFKVTLATLMAAFRAMPRLRSSYEELTHVSDLTNSGTIGWPSPYSHYLGTSPQGKTA
ncbi:MAG: glycosyltransferase family 2 protein [Anaerolineae bacterium]|nr:glycosyltransferase family 2 protein [Anaerolineae bacterium]